MIFHFQHNTCKKSTAFARYVPVFLRVAFACCIGVLCCLQPLRAAEVEGNTLDEIYVTLSLQDENLRDLIRKIEKSTDLMFTFQYDQVKKVNNLYLPLATRSVKDILDQVLTSTPLIYKQVTERMVVVYRGDKDVIDEGKGEIKTIVTGVVMDGTTHAALPGVNILVKGTTRGTTTDNDGNYSIEANDRDVLIFSYIGFVTFETQVNGRTMINATMEEDQGLLQPVEINAGYWRVTAQEKTGSISRITKEDIAPQPVSNPLQAMQGRMAGVYIESYSGLPGSNFEINIRGLNSLQSGGLPLYIIDGVPFVGQSMSDDAVTLGLFGGNTQYNGVSPLGSIEPSDIESIEVLKDADATAIYGSRAANGVVLITTKKGKAGKTRLDINVNTGFSKVPQKLEVLNTEQYLAMRREAFANDGRAITRTTAPEFFLWDTTTQVTDWHDVLIGGTARVTNAQATISGGSDHTQFLISGTYQGQTTVLPGDTRADRGSTHFSINHTSLDEKFSAMLFTTYSVNTSDFPAFDLTDYVWNSLPPFGPPLYNEDGTINWKQYDLTSNLVHPLAQTLASVTLKSYNLINNAVLKYELLPGLRLEASMGVNDLRQEDKQEYPFTVQPPGFGFTSANSRINTNSATSRTWLIEPQLNWAKQIGAGRLKLMVGGTVQKQTLYKIGQQFDNFPNTALMGDPKAALNKRLGNFVDTEYRYNSLFARINYEWKEKYIINLTGRRDGSSRFGPGNRFAHLGAVGAAWIFSKEQAVENKLPWLSFGKLRASYGITGNDQIGDYQYLDSYSTGQTAIIYQGVTTLRPTRLPNADYAWETNRKTEAALELGFFKNRIFAMIGYFRNRSSNQLVNYKLAATTGFSSILQNFEATVQNSGFEVELRTINIEKGAWRWSTTFNLTVPDNKLVSFPGLEASTYATTYQVGKSLNVTRRYHYTGLDDATGIYQFEDMNTDGIISPADQLKFVERGLHYYGGLGNSLAFNGFTLEVFFQFVSQAGGDGVTAISDTPGAQPRNFSPYLLEGRWQEPGQGATKQKLTSNAAARSAFTRYKLSDAIINNDASFIRLKNVALSYQLPERFTGGVKSRLYVQGQNLHTFTRYKGLDPESDTPNRLPTLRTLVFGLQVTF